MKSLKRHKLLRRAFSTVMALALAVSLLPTCAFAANVPTSTATSGSAADFAGAWASAHYKPGTYTVTANLAMPGAYNPILKGATVYANNPNNPFGATDPDDPCENVDTTKAPTTPLTDNATLTVKNDGTLELHLGIHNPIFTTQKVGTCPDLAYTATRLEKTYSASGNSISGRVYQLDATLGKTALDAEGIATYNFKGSELFAVPLALSFKPDGDIALQLTVDLSSIPVEDPTLPDPDPTDDRPDAITGKAPVAGTVTRTTQLDLCSVKSASGCSPIADSTDKLSTEGWRWEKDASGNGGTLTLKNFYMKLDTLRYQSNGGAIFFTGDVKLVLEGTNVIETNDSWFADFLGGHTSSPASITVMETKAGGSLELRTSSTVSFSDDNRPYGFSTKNLVIRSGTVLGNVSLCSTQQLDMTGGKVDIALDDRFSGEDAVLVHGDVNLTGGELKVRGGAAAVAIVNFDSDTTEHAIRVAGDASVDLAGCRYGLYAQKISVDTTGSFTVDSDSISRDAIYAYDYIKDCISIRNIGQTNLTPNDIFPNTSSYCYITPADFTALDAAIASAPEDLLVYTGVSASAVTTQIANANSHGIRSSSFLEQMDVDQATAAVQDAIAALVPCERRTYPTLDTDFSQWITYTMPQANNGGTDISLWVYGKTDDSGNGIGIFSTKTGATTAVSKMKVSTKELHLSNSEFEQQYGLLIQQDMWGWMWGSWGALLGEYNDISATAIVLEKKAAGPHSVFYLAADYGDHVERFKLESVVDSQGTARVLVNPDLFRTGYTLSTSNTLTPFLTAAYNGTAGTAAAPILYVGEVQEIPADYTAVDAALSKIPADLETGYSAASVEALNHAKNAVDRTKLTQQQDQVDAMAEALEAAIRGLQKRVAVPEAITGLVYNKAYQVGVPEGEGYTLTGNTGKDAGDYTAIATLQKGYVWADDSTEDKTVFWSIAEAAPTYTAPILVSGNGAQWKYGSDQGLTFRISEGAGALLKAAADGAELANSNYSAEEQSFTLNANYLNTLAKGKHTITLTYQGGSVTAEFTTIPGTKEIQVKRLQPGTYTVTANIWFEKADSGLPMNPHLTNSSFPPKDPVTDNATLRVDANGRAFVTVPIVIQSKVMTIQTITGLSISDSVRDSAGNLTSVTIDLGVLEDFDEVISKTCTISLQMGDLAMSISGFDRDQTWRAHFQINLTDIPTVQVTKTITIGQNGTEAAPETGDSSSAALFVGTMTLSLLAAAVVLCSRKRRAEDAG